MAFQLSNKVNPNLFTTNFTPESSYILGLLWADGTVSKTSNRIDLQCLKEDIDYVYPIFQTTGKFNLYYKKQPLNHKISGTINFSSKPISDFLKDNMYLTKSSSSHNDILSKIPEHYHNYFFLGLSDGDGCFYHSLDFNVIQYIIASSYEQNWESLENLCNKLNISYRISRVIRKSSKYSQFQINSNKDILTLGDYLYSNHMLGLPRKRNKFLNIKQQIIEKNSIKIQCYSKDNVLLHTFNTLTEASNWVGKPRNVSSDILDVCKGRQQSAFGYLWKKVKIE